MLSSKDMRFIISETTNPKVNLITEEVILNAVNEGFVSNTIMLWINDRCLVAGRGSKGYGWYHEQLATQLGINVYKRITGGGVVYHDKGNLNWSFFIRHENKNIDIIDLFKEPAEIIINALNRLGIEAYFMPPNRIEFKGYKISGMASYVKKNAILVHGTLLVESNLEELNKLCIPPLNSPPVTNLAYWIKGLTISTIINSIEEALKINGFNVKKAGLTEWEITEIRKKLS
jgi:lipoate-protein ligase A